MTISAQISDHEGVNRRSAVVVGVCLSVIAVSAFLVLPVFIGAAVVSMDLSERQVGFLASAVMSGSAVSSIFTLFWIRKVNWRLASYVALSILLLGYLGAIASQDVTMFTACLFLASLGGGSAYSLALTCLSDNRQADRCFGYSVAAQVTFQVIGMLVLPVVAESLGVQGLLTIFAALAGLGLFLTRYLPESGVEITVQGVGSALYRPTVLAALAGCFFFFFNVGVLWTYIERIGDSAGFDAGLIGLSLAVGVAFGIPGALGASWCGNRFGRLRPLALGAVLTVVALILLLSSTLSLTAYMVSLALYNFAWNFSLAFQYAAVNAVDETGRGVALAPAFHGGGGAVGPAVAALFVSAGNFTAVSLFAGVAVLLSLALFALALGTHGSPKE
ncbi:MAG: MFS transporter [Halieaceae bacterium]